MGCIVGVIAGGRRKLRQYASSMVVELVVFSVKAGISASDMRAAFTTSDGFLRSQSGFVRRRPMTTAQGDTYVDMVEWDSLTDAEAAAQAFADDARTAKLRECIDGKSVQFFHLTDVFSTS